MVRRATADAITIFVAPALVAGVLQLGAIRRAEQVRG